MNTFWQWFWLLVWSFFFICYLMVLFQVITDLFRDHELSGWWKAIWVILLIIFPLITLLIYLIARGSGMGQRQLAAARAAQEATNQYIQSVASGGTARPTRSSRPSRCSTPGAITQAEFDQLKAKALA